MEKYPALSPEYCRVLYNGIDTAKFICKRLRPARKRSDPLSFLFASAWIDIKGVQILADTVRTLSIRYGRDVRFTICGSVDLWSMSPEEYRRQEPLRQLVRSLKQYPGVTIRERTARSDMPWLFRSSDYCLFPSVWREPFALVILESLSCGTPVIAFARGGTKEIIENKQNGLLIPTPGSVPFTNTLEKVITEFRTSEYRHMSLEARKTAEKFSEIQRRTQLVQILNRL